MGIKHLTKIKKLLESSDRPIGKTEIRDTLNIDLGTVKEALAYLLEEGTIEKIKNITEVEKYRLK